MDLADARRGGLAVPELVEEADGPAAKESFGYESGCGRKLPGAERQWRPARPCGNGVQRSVITAGQYRAAHRGSAGQEVDPGDRVPVEVIGLGEASHQVVQVNGAFRVDRHERGFDRQELDGGSEDDPGESHPMRPSRRTARCRAR